MKALEPGTVLHGTYEIVRVIGTGGMGVVYEARDLRLPRRLAIKVLSGQGDASPVDVERFHREAKIAASLRHPHIVQVIELCHGTEMAGPSIVMELLDGRDLAAELAACGRLPLSRVVRLLDQVASALASAHGLGIVHRDLKPQNLFLLALDGAERDFVKVLDFGISKTIAGATVTDGARLLGTPQYMAPEQARGRADDVDGRSDQFALAAVAWELLVGRPPFAGECVASTLFAIVHHEPVPS